jgi:acetyl-CoA acetyltransferase
MDCSLPRWRLTLASLEDIAHKHVGDIRWVKPSARHRTLDGRIGTDALDRSAAPRGTALTLARLLNAELAALFVENIDLLRLAEFPQAAESRLFAPAAVPLALRRAGLAGVGDVDVWEVNQAFAVVDLVNAKLLGLDPDRVNVLGGSVALGHPIGCSGAFLATKAVYELHRTGGRYALVTMCIGGGQGIAAVFERL